MASSDRLRALVDLSRTISSSLDLEDVLRRFTDHATAVTGAAATAVSLWDRDRDVLITLDRLREQRGRRNCARPMRSSRWRTIPDSRRVMEERVPFVVRTADPGAHPSERKILEELGYRSMLMLPLVSRGEPIGLMEIADVRDREWDEDIEFFGALCDVVAAAVHNAVLHAEHHKAASRLPGAGRKPARRHLHGHGRQRRSGLRQPTDHGA